MLTRPEPGFCLGQDSMQIVMGDVRLFISMSSAAGTSGPVGVGRLEKGDSFLTYLSIIH